MYLFQIALVLGLVLGGCGAVVKNGGAQGGLSAAEITGVSDAFVRNWCDKEPELSQDTALTVNLLIAATDATNCKAAATELAKKTEIALGDAYFEGELMDLRPIATLTGLQTVKLNHLGLTSVARLFPLRGLPGLTSLDLSQNKLTHVRGLARYTPKLNTLILSGNPLVDKPAEAPLFSKLESEVAWKGLLNLTISESTLAAIPTGIPASVETLDVRHNKFGPTPFAALAPANPAEPAATNLKTLLLEDCFAKEVTDDVRAKVLLEVQGWMKETRFKF